MRKQAFLKKALSIFICILFTFDNAFALNATTDILSHTSSVNPTTSGNTTKITTTHNIDMFHWSSFNLGAKETANYIFNTNGQTAVNYLTPGANPSSIYGSIVSSGAKGNIFLFNPNGIMMGQGSSVTGANTFFASTNKFNGIVDGKVTFSEADINNSLNIGNVRLNNVNNAIFVAPNVILKADSIKTADSVSVKAIGGGKYDVSSNIFTNVISVKTPIPDSKMINIDAKVESNKIDIEAKADANTYATALILGEIKANKAVTGDNGEIYIVASNDNTSSEAGARIIQNAFIKGDSAQVNINTQNFIQNGDIDVSGSTGGSVDIKANSYDQYANIAAKGANGAGGNIDIMATESYIATEGTSLNVSGKTQGGDISLQGDYQILSSGNYNSSSAGGKGGDIKISAPLTKLYGVNIDVSGNTQGGDVYIGGAGTSGIEINDSYISIINDGSTINASSSNGKGGNVYIDSIGDTYAFGTINTSGKGLNGGYIELCGKESLKIGKNISAGLGGTIYIDPKNIIITDSEIGNICYNLLFTDSTPINISLDLSKGSNFGSSIALYNNLLAVGAEGSGSTHKGAAYLFYFDEGTRFNDLSLFKTLADGVNVGDTQLSLSDNANFGSSIALTNKFLAIGASGENSGDGKVFLFDFTPDTDYSNLKYDISKTGDTGQKAFGSSLALYEYTADETYNLLAVGAEGGSGNLTGKEYIYRFTYDSSTNPYNGMSQIATLSGPSGILDNDYFGSGSALSTFTSGATTYGLLAVGASGEAPVEGGTVYLYQFDLENPSDLTPKLELNNDTVGLVISPGDAFGSSIALMPITLLELPYNLIAVGSENCHLTDTVNSGGVHYLSIDSDYSLETNGAIRSGTSGQHLGSGVAFGQTPIGSPTYALLAMGLSGNSSVTAYSEAGKIYLFTFTPNTKYSNLNFYNEYYADSIVKGTQSLSAGDLFGSSVALYENLLAIGARGDATGGTGTGAVYLYNFTLGSLYQNLTLNSKLAYGSNVLDTSGDAYTLNLAAGSNFGFSVALQDGLLAVGATGADSGKGAVYLFSFNSGTNYYPLTINEVVDDTYPDVDLVAGDHFGSGVAISDSLLAVGAEYKDEGLDDKAGAVYLFTYNSGTPFVNLVLAKELQSISGSYELEADDNFGNAVSLYENYLAVGAYQGSSQTPATHTGSVYLFDVSSPSNPSRITTISSVPGNTLTNFGSSVSLYDNKLGVGDMTSDSYKGSVYLFYINNDDYANPVFSKKLKNRTELINNSGGTYTLNLEGYNQFGCSISIYENLLAIGAQLYSKNNSSTHEGTVYLLNILDTTISDYTFGAYPSATLYIPTSLLSSWLNSGNVTLQANNDIEFQSPVTISDGAGNTLILQAGGSITIDDNLAIDLGNADLDATANENATGTALVDDDHESVMAEFKMYINSSITTDGNVTITMNTGEGKTFLESGDITLESISAKNIFVYNNGTTIGSDIILNDILTTIATTANPLILSSDKGNIINNHGEGALVVDSDQRWLIYTGSPNQTNLNGLTCVNTYYSANISTVPPSSVCFGDSVLYRSSAPSSHGGSSVGGIIAGGTVGGVAAGGAAAGAAGLGFLPGLLLGLASPIQFDETMIDIIDKNVQSYPLLVRDIQYVYQTDDISKLTPDDIGMARFIPDQDITNGSYEMLKFKVPNELMNSPKGVRVVITQKSLPFAIHKNIPDMNFNVFNSIPDNQLSSIYRTRRFLKPKYMSDKTITTATNIMSPNDGIVQKTIYISPSQTKNGLSVVVNNLKNGHFPRKSNLDELTKQAYALVVQFSALE